MDPTWMAFASLLFQIGLLIALIVCCLLIKIFVTEVGKKFDLELRNRAIALLGGFLFAGGILIYTAFSLNGTPITQMFIIAELIGFLGRFGVFSFIMYFILGRMAETSQK